MIDILPPNVTGAIQWLDRSLNGELKKLHNQQKRAIHARYDTFAKDQAANAEPICHTANGNPKALPQHYQALTLCQAFDELKHKDIDWHYQLLQNGYLWFTELADTKKHYLEHLQDEMFGSESIFKCINSLNINPFEASFEAILNAKCGRGPVLRDVGKNSRTYSKHEATVLKDIYDTVNNKNGNVGSNNNANNSNDSNSNEIVEFNNTMHFEIIRECTNQIAKEIKQALNLPEKEKCNKPANFLSVWLGCQSYDMIVLYNEILFQKYGNKNGAVCRESNNDGLNAKQWKKQQLLNKMQEKLNYLRKLHLN